MIETLSPQERAAVCMYNQRVQGGDTEEAPIWADSFTAHMFYGHEEAVIDIGCGLGRIVPILEDYGVHAYIGIDPSSEHIRFCNAHFPDRCFEVAEVRQLGSGNLTGFGGFIMLNVLMHTPKEDLADILMSVRRSQLPGAIGLLNTQSPAIAEHISEDAKHLGFTFYETKEVVDALHTVSLQVMRVREHEGGCMYHVVAI